ncbi:hypothetical protein DSO57_1036917 [Entomophthora muscae]|uniref:Uncharacterized protein n=1 Tax=Entomophthora muscae TaxID=34485 RepID=A0ACC2S1G6_9FUNG|nr:hypothetical protein DSO57_1036917 [Entomophthora muscae]
MQLFTKLFVVFLALAAAEVSKPSKFKIDLKCQYDAWVCEQAEKGFSLSAIFLENALDLQTTVNIKADYSDYSGNSTWDKTTTGTYNPI